MPTTADNKKLGTFSGVFTPSILTILGLILFLRMGYVLGSGGLGRALLIICLANLISILTSFSLAAITSNLKVKGGGDYYLISRTLGVEFGGAIGIVLFLAQSISIAFYCIGFGEAIASIVVVDIPFFPQISAALALAMLFILTWLGADWATKFQYLIMATLVLALISFFSGALQHWSPATLVANWQGNPQKNNFWILFAIFFPAVTGFTQGVSMSGDLQDPGKNLPLGTFLAVGLSFLVYLAVAVVFSGAVPGDTLIRDYQAINRVASWGFLIDAGVIAATLSSALASFLGAPRILQSLASDHIFPFLDLFAKGSGANNNPRRGILLSLTIAGLTIGLGQLDLIAGIVTMFFLISYGLLNYATYFEARSKSPSFRPRFKWYHQKVSLAGFLACLGVMMAIDIKIGILAVTILFAIYQYLQKTSGPARWADGQRSYQLQQARNNILAAAGEKEHPRDWRPYLLALSDNSERRCQLINFATWIEGGSGLTAVVRFIPSNGVRMQRLHNQAEQELRRDINHCHSDAFPLVINSSEPSIGLQTLVQSWGIGPMHANTLLLNWLEQHPGPGQERRELLYGKNLRIAYHQGCNLIIWSGDEESVAALAEKEGEEKQINVWWNGDRTSRLMLLLAYLLTRHEEWKGATIRLFALNYDSASAENEEHLAAQLEETRIKTVTEIISKKDSETIISHSADASITFVPFRLHGDLLEDLSGEPVEQILSRLQMAALVLAAEDIDLDAEPEEGGMEEVVAALDHLEHAEKRAHLARKEANNAVEEAEKTLAAIKLSGQKFPDDLLLRIAAAREAREAADQALQRASKEEAKSTVASKAVEKLGGKTESSN
ncbi:MAG: amino acid permease [Proteobacteria bacterium]|nr:amino acid permease [Pseudomonadota bacterium]MBU1058167.1 amino acid permease [Pseudomonadota bacterium]